MAGFFESFDPRLGPQAATPRTPEEEAAIRQGQTPGLGVSPQEREAARQQALASLGDARTAPNMVPVPPSAFMPPAGGGTPTPFISRKTFTPPTPQQVGTPQGAYTQAPPAPQRGPMPDFTARPEGEMDREQFLGLQMLRMGRNAPQWMTQEFRDIEQAKSARIMARANYLANMNQMQYRADLQRRNQWDNIHSSEVQGALNRSLEARLTGAQMEQARQIANANFQLRSQQVDQQKAANRIAQAQQNIQNIAQVKEKYAPQLDQIGGEIANLNDMQRLIVKARDRLGGGALNFNSLLATLGSDEAQRLQKMIAQLQLKVDTEGQGTISDFERKLIGLATGDTGQTAASLLDDLAAQKEQSMQRLNRTVEIMDSLAPQASMIVDPQTGEATRVVGVGTAAKADLHDILLETMVQNRVSSQLQDRTALDLRRQAALEERMTRY